MKPDKLVLSTLEGKYYRKYMIQFTKDKSGKQDIMMSYSNSVRHLMLPELQTSQGCDGQDTFKG
jgi:hypothetical protein